MIVDVGLVLVVALAVMAGVGLGVPWGEIRAAEKMGRATDEMERELAVLRVRCSEQDARLRGILADLVALEALRDAGAGHKRGSA